VGCPDDPVLHSGRGPATAVVLTLNELEDLAFATADHVVRERLLCAIALHDTVREQRIRTELSPIK
jgi:hypothetical protein